MSICCEFEKRTASFACVMNFPNHEVHNPWFVASRTTNRSARENKSWRCFTQIHCIHAEEATPYAPKCIPCLSNMTYVCSNHIYIQKKVNCWACIYSPVFICIYLYLSLRSKMQVLWGDKTIVKAQDTVTSPNYLCWVDVHTSHSKVP